MPAREWENACALLCLHIFTANAIKIHSGLLNFNLPLFFFSTSGSNWNLYMPLSCSSEWSQCYVAWWVWQMPCSMAKFIPKFSACSTSKQSFAYWHFQWDRSASIQWKCQFSVYVFVLFLFYSVSLFCIKHTQNLVSLYISNALRS